MDRSLRWMLASSLGMFLAGAAGAYVWFSLAVFREPAFAGMLFLDILGASFLGMQAHRRGLRMAVPTGALAGGLGIVGFFSTPLALYWNDGIDVGIVLFLMGVAGAFSLACSAGGTYYLARGVDRHRALHGMAHAPR